MMGGVKCGEHNVDACPDILVLAASDRRLGVGRVERNQRLPSLSQKPNDECRGMTTKQTPTTVTAMATPQVDSRKTGVAT